MSKLLKISISKLELAFRFYVITYMWSVSTQIFYLSRPQITKKAIHTHISSLVFLSNFSSSPPYFLFFGAKLWQKKIILFWLDIENDGHKGGEIGEMKLKNNLVQILLKLKKKDDIFALTNLNQIKGYNIGEFIIFFFYVSGL